MSGVARPGRAGRGRPRAAVACGALLVVVGAAACGGRGSGPAPGFGAAPVAAPAPPFAWAGVDGRPLTSESVRGRSVVLLFVTTFDPASQVAAKQLEGVVRTHRPRANAGAIVLEPPQHHVLAEVFQRTLGLSYPVAMADAGTLAGDSPFGSIDRVPTVVVLDARGRVVRRESGLAGPRALDRWLGEADQRGPVSGSGVPGDSG